MSGTKKQTDVQDSELKNEGTTTMTMMHETSAFSKRSQKAQEFEGVITGTSLVRLAEARKPEASRRTRRAIRRRRYA